MSQQYRYVNSKLEKKYGILNTYIYMLKMLWGFNKWYFLGCLIQSILKGIMPVVDVYFPKLIVQCILVGDFRKTIYYALLMLGINLVIYIVVFYFTVKDSLIKNLFGTYLNIKFLEKTVELDQSLLDNKDVHDLRQKAAETVNNQMGLSFVNEAFTFISTIITIVPVIIIIAPLGILAFTIVLIFLAIDITAQIISRKIEYQYFINTNEENRKAAYLISILNNDKHKNDIKMYSLAKFIITKYEEVRMSIMQKLKKMYVSGAVVYVISGISQLISTAMLYILLGYNMIFKGMSFDLFTLYFGAINQLNSSAQSIRQRVVNAYQMCRYINHYRSFLDLQNIIAVDTDIETEKVIPDITKDFSLTFRNVSFTYPESTDLILNKINLKFEKGKFYVMVGANGTGKTTIVKLLCRLYDVTGGEILLDNTNIKDFYYKKYRKLFGTVFQDYFYYNITVKENITFDNTVKNDDLKLTYAIENSGLSSKIQTLKKGVDNYLGKLFDKDGIELSGGESQKLAISKALYIGAEFFILDEPSSALDPEAEYDLIQTFLKLRDEGKTILFISHRLSTVNYADEVIFVDHGNTIQGTHGELMKSITKYNDMYTKQSSLYIHNSGDTDE